MEDKIQQWESRQFKAIFPSTLNANNTLFGGQAMKWMDEVAYITATRFTRQKMVTVNTENIKFLKAVHPNSIVEIIGQIIKTTNVRIYVQVQIFSEEMYGTTREKVIEGIFVLACLDEGMRPKRINYLPKITDSNI